MSARAVIAKPTPIAAAAYARRRSARAATIPASSSTTAIHRKTSAPTIPLRRLRQRDRLVRVTALLRLRIRGGSLEMLVESVRRVTLKAVRITLATFAALLAWGCTEPVAQSGGTNDDPVALGQRYDADPQFRREILERSLVNPRNGYSQKRLALYDDELWGALPIWNPEARGILVDDRVPPDGDAPGWGALESTPCRGNKRR